MFDEQEKKSAKEVEKCLSSLFFCKHTTLLVEVIKLLYWIINLNH